MEKDVERTKTNRLNFYMVSGALLEMQNKNRKYFRADEISRYMANNLEIKINEKTVQRNFTAVCRELLKLNGRAKLLFRSFKICVRLHFSQKKLQEDLFFVWYIHFIQKEENRNPTKKEQEAYKAALTQKDKDEIYNLINSSFQIQRSQDKKRLISVEFHFPLTDEEESEGLGVFLSNLFQLFVEGSPNGKRMGKENKKPVLNFGGDAEYRIESSTS